MTNPEATPSRRRESTSTSNFGVGRRESHDASALYERFAKPTIVDATDLAPHAARDQIWCGDARTMDLTGQIADLRRGSA